MAKGAAGTMKVVREGDRFLILDGNERVEETILCYDILSVKKTDKGRDIIYCPQMKHGRKLKTFHCTGTLSNEKELDACTVEPAKFLILVNPVAGSGHAVSRVEKFVKPVFDAAGCTYEVINTTYQGHATEIAKKENLDQYKAVVIVSGDGLIHELLQGLAWAGKLQVPVAHIPGGSGNALVSCLLSKAKESIGDAISASFMCVKGLPSPLDLCQITVSSPQDSPNGVTSSLSTAWGIIADVDKESESLRFIGGARFSVLAVWRVLFNRTYRGELWYLPAGEKQGPMPPLSEELPDTFIKYPMNHFSGIITCNMPKISETCHCAPDADMSNGTLELIVLPQMSRWQALKMLLDFDSGDYLKRGVCQVVKCTQFRLVPERYSKRNPGWIMVDGEAMPYGPVQGSVNPGEGRVISLPPKQIATS